MKFTEISSPAIARMAFDNPETGRLYYEWKVSPHIEEDDFDTGAVWCDTKAEALEVAQKCGKRIPNPRAPSALDGHDNGIPATVDGLDHV